MNIRLLYLNLIIILVGLPILLVLWLLPFDFFVKVHYADYKNMCAGDKLQTVISYREVKLADAYKANVQAELVRYEDDLVLETIIRRNTDFFFEKNDAPVVYEIEWDHPVPAGVYGVQSIVTLNTIFPKKDFRKADNFRFKVVDCI